MCAVFQLTFDIRYSFYNFRLVLKCRARARKNFAAIRSDVLVKLELLDNKHFQDMVFQLKRLLEGLAKFHIQTQQIVSQEKLFPIEVDWIPPSINETDDQIEWMRQRKKNVYLCSLMYYFLDMFFLNFSKMNSANI